jgi:hypothetical protein
MSFFDCPNCFEAIIDRPACRDCGFDLASALAAIAAVAKWEIIAAMPPAVVTGHAVDLPRRAANRRVWGPRCNPA